MIVEYLRNYRNFTYTEEVIRDYILEYPQNFITFSINDLSRNCNVGVASVMRLCKKMGFNGYTDFKTNFIKEFKDMERMYNLKKVAPFDQNTTVNDIVNDLPYVYEKAIGYTKLAIDYNVLHRAVNQIQNATVLVFGTSINKSVAEIFAYKLEELGIICKVLDSVHYQLITSLNYKKTPLFGILLTHKGNNKAVIEAAKYLKKSKIPSLLICAEVSEEVREYCNDILYIIPTDTTREFSNTQFMMAEQYLLDIIYSMLFVKNIKMISEINSKEKYRKYYKGENHEKEIK